MSKPRYIAGAMSGTSADGVDVAIVQVTGRGEQMSAQLIAHRHVEYDRSIREGIFTSRQHGSVRLSDLAKLGRDVGLAYARAVTDALAAANLRASDLSAVAAHGQTLYHEPPNTIQWFDPALLAGEVGCAVVSDFRRADCAAGGQGAPLVPFADYILFRDAAKNRALMNIGGIGNVTWLKAGGSLGDVIAFDTGPGNCVIDHVCRQDNPQGPGYDPEGQLARMVPASRTALEWLLAQPYFEKLPPRSTDGPAMIELFEAAPDMASATFPTRVATATLFAVASIELSIAGYLPGKPDELIVSGGGTRNGFMMQHLRGWFPGTLMTSDDLGVPSDAKEAIAFALLGAATLDGVPSNVPSVTGASRGVVLGSITPRP